MIRFFTRSVLISSISIGAFGCSSSDQTNPGSTPDGSVPPPMDGRVPSGTGGATADAKPSCTLRLPGVTVKLTDASNGNRICDATVTLTDVNDASYTETLVVSGPTASECLYSGAEERPGTYKVEASKAGYQTSSVTVTVTQSSTGCKHVIPQSPVLELAPS